MTKAFSVQFTCPHCGNRSSAETSFCQWMRSRPELESKDGIVRTDTDHTILRYKTTDQGRDYQLIMDVEVKEFGSYPDPSQRDILGFKHQIAMRTGRNRFNAKTIFTHKLKSLITGRLVRVRYCGFHLLQFEKTNPADSAWIKWDNRQVSVETLVGILSFELNPYYPDKPMSEFLRDRHSQRNLFEIAKKSTSA